MLNGMTQQEISQTRQEFERGLLSVISNENRQKGLQLIAQVARRFGSTEVMDDTWPLLEDWLEALKKGEIALTTECFVLLREVGKVLKQLDNPMPVSKLPAGGVVAQLPALRVQLTNALAGINRQSKEQQQRSAQDGVSAADQASWGQALDDLQNETDLSSLRASFIAVADIAAELSWSDVLEITSAQINLLDRLLDGTLPSDSQHREVFADAIALLRRLDEPKPEQQQTSQSQIDDQAYERVIERADVLASGGEFAFADTDSNTLAHSQLVAVLDALPGLLQLFREECAAQVTEAGLNQELQQLAAAAKQLQAKLPPAATSQES